ncbi:MAG TPA: NAD-dependent epimerase/dehydratase family protein, partial [Myxococcaceae bacterium]|nr:NAD-dependent epimerase/dehydratase family protein [Myxococcaceae bacterium]
MKIAVTGGTGFIGRPLVDRLTALGHAIVLLSRRPESVGARDGIEASFFDAERPFTGAGLRGAEAVIHLAGESIATRWTPEAKRRIRESRVAGTAAMAQAAREAGTVKTLLSASAIGYYGPRGSEPLTESSPPGNDFLARVC